MSVFFYKSAAFGKEFLLKRLCLTRRYVCAVFLLCLLFFTLGAPLTARAHSGNFDVFFDDEGNLVMTSNDRAAGGSVSYRTVGWTVKKEDKPMGETSSTRVNQIEFLREIDPDDPSRVITTYKVSEDKLFERIENCDSSWAKDIFRNGGYVYLDAVMVVVRDGTPSGGINEDGSIWGRVYFTADSIKNAENWADPGSLDSHFGKQAFFAGDTEKLWGELNVKYYEVTDDDFDSAQSLDFLGVDREEPLKDREYEVECEDLTGYGLDFTYSAICSVDKDGLTTKYGGQPVYNVDNFELNLKSVTICFYYESRVNTEELVFTYGKDHISTENGAVLQAQPVNDPEFDAGRAIPSGEMLWAKYRFQKYYFTVELQKYSGSRLLPVVVCIYHYDDKGRYKEKKKKIYVAARYSYFRIKKARIYEAASAVIENGALAEKVMFSNVPGTEIVHVTDRGSYVRLPEEPAVAYVSKETYDSEGEDALKEAAEYACEGPEVRNDSLSIDGSVLLDGRWMQGSTAGFSVPGDSVTAEVIRENIQIPAERANGKYESRAHVFYKKMRISSGGVLSDTGESVSHETMDVNDVFVHTPVVCRGGCSDAAADNQQYVHTEFASLILGKSFTLSISETGEHIDETGYGLRDYGKYSRKKQVRMPFPVYYGEKYVLPYTWVSMTLGSISFYLPVGVEEGDYEIEYRVFSVNCDEAGVLPSSAETADGARLEKISERYANKDSAHYIAWDKLTVTVTGRMYDIAVTGVVDYPAWWSVFYSGLGVKKDVKYRAGRLSMEGEALAERAGAPLIPVMERYYKESSEENGTWDVSDVTGLGSDAEDKNLKIPGAGYRINFELKTIGSMRGENDGIVMIPRYFHISNDGKVRTEVKLYAAGDLKSVYTPVVLTVENRSFQPVFRKNVADHMICEQSLQVWSGSYRLPDDIYAVSMDVNLAQYIQRRSGRIRQDDSIFMKGGYILVQFEILSMRDGTANLSYINRENAQAGCCNMWKRQGFVYDRSFPNGQTFSFEDGDFFLFDMEKTINSDYESWGTH